jgi:hypothetical protein
MSENSIHCNLQLDEMNIKSECNLDPATKTASGRIEEVNQSRIQK